MPEEAIKFSSLTNLMRGIYKRRALAPCDFLLNSFYGISCANDIQIDDLRGFIFRESAALIVWGWAIQN